MSTTTVALTDKALSCLVVLVSLMTSFRKSNSSQVVQLIQLHHKLLDCPDFSYLTKTLHEGHNFVIVGQVDQRMAEKGHKVDL
jgi:hypothetical protein